MNDTVALAELEDLQAILSEAGYVCRIGSLGRFSRVLLAENPYALMAGIETESWSGLHELVSDIQAELTHLAIGAEHMSVRWDLYVLLHVRSPGLTSIEGGLLEQVEADTKYARKLVRVNMTRDKETLDRALRPLLPLRPAAALEGSDPVELLRAELLDQDIDEDVVHHALARFVQTGEVTVP